MAFKYFYYKSTQYGYSILISRVSISEQNYNLNYLEKKVIMKRGLVHTARWLTKQVSIIDLAVRHCKLGWFDGKLSNRKLADVKYLQMRT